MWGIRAALKLPLHCGSAYGYRFLVNAEIRAALKLPLHCGLPPTPTEYGSREEIRAALKLPLHCGLLVGVVESTGKEDSGSSKAAPPLRGRSSQVCYHRIQHSGSSKAAPPLRVGTDTPL